jgi:hypothetical protein
VLLHLAGHISSKNSGGNSTIPVVLFLIFGALLLILAVRNFFGEDDPDVPPPKKLRLLNKLGPVKFFGWVLDCRCSNRALCSWFSRVLH